MLYAQSTSTVMIIRVDSDSDFQRKESTFYVGELGLCVCLSVCLSVCAKFVSASAFLETVLVRV